MGVKIVCESSGGGTAELGPDVTVSYKVASVADLPAPELFHAWIKLTDGRTLSLFVNRETGLVVADAHEKRGPYGSEFIRRTVPPPLSKSDRRKLAAMKASGDVEGA
jgi:hypothetical protein